MTIHLIRADHANEFELQNYTPLADKHNISVITSHHPLTDISLHTTQLWSPTDLPNFPFRRQLLNRLIGGEQWLLGLRSVISRYHVLKHDNNEIILHTAETYTPYTHQAVQLRKEGVIDHLVCTCWETIPHNNEKFRRVRRWKQEAYQYVDIFHTSTTRARDALVTEGVDQAKIKVIPYGIDLTRFHPEKHRVNKRPTILTVARLEKEKGMAELETIARSLPQYNFRVIGRGRYHFATPNITTTTLPYDQIHTAYQSADLLLFPSRTTPTWEEQYGMALIEAMACGLPIITTDSGAIPEVVGNAGIVLPESDFAAHASAKIQRVINTPTIHTKLSHLSLTRAIERYDRNVVAKKLDLLY